MNRKIARAALPKARASPISSERAKGRSQLDLELNPDVLGLLKEKLAKQQRASLRDEQYANSMRGVPRRPFEASFEAAVQAPTRHLQVGQVDAEHRAQARVLQPDPDRAAQFSPILHEYRRGRDVGLFAENDGTPASGHPRPFC